ncbi:MAG: methylenetetrahydrofolate reductase [Actinomycetota bacterium]
MALFGKKYDESEASRAHRIDLTDQLTFELIPLKSLTGAVEALPAGAEVSMTCSPAKGIDETQRLTAELQTEGYTVIPHFSARMVRDKAHTAELAAWCRELGLKKVFLVGGDAEEPGDYPGAVEFLADFLETDHGLDTIGVTAYPDGHVFLSDEKLHWALHEKQRMLAEAGVDGYCSTQMCFDPDTIAKWLRTEREQGLTLPVHLGISGVVDKSKLLTMGARLGIGDSLKYLRKNVGAVVKMMTTVNYDPNDLLLPLSADLVDLGVEGLHVFTFNQVAATNEWREEVLAG